MGYKIYHRPIYKFLNIDGALKTLKSGSLKYSCPSKFNDPLDGSKVIFSFRPYKNNLENNSDHHLDKSEQDFIKEHIKREFGNEFYEKIFQQTLSQTILKDRKNNVNREIASRLIQQEMFEKYELNNYRICCFSRTYTSKRSFLMWSHYADAHQGVCLEFQMQIKENERFLQTPLMVNYPSLIEKVYSENDFLGGYWLLNKLPVWKYEQEIRIIRKTGKAMKGTHSLFKFDKNALKKIVFGYNTPDKTIMKIRKLIDNLYDKNTLSFEKMVVDEESMRLIPLKYDIDYLTVFT